MKTVSTAKAVNSILDHVMLKNTNKDYARVTRNAFLNKARELGKDSLIPVMLKKQAF